MTASTPPATADILEGITRDSIMRLAREGIGLRVVEREIDRTERYIADEIFFNGTDDDRHGESRAPVYP